ncbi:MAG: hypothetical protein NZ941_07260 [Candidatus Caldarchaeum sp.]|nr:hypothetical protein [Candidatus Caldarchaeum sp.]
MKNLFLLLTIVVCLFLIPAASSQDAVISYYGFYGSVDSNNRVINPATVVVEDQVFGFYTTANPRAYFYVEFKTIKAPYELLLKWIGPDGQEFASPIRRTEPGVITDAWFWWSLTLNEELTAGVWRVVLLYNNQKILESSFMLQKPQTVVSRIGELVEENEKLAAELEDSKAEVKTLKENLTTASSRVQQLEAEKSLMQTEIAGLRESLSKTSAELTQAQSSNNQLSQRLASETNRADSLEQQRTVLAASNAVVAAAAVAAVVFSRRRKHLPPPPSP